VTTDGQAERETSAASEEARLRGLLPLAALATLIVALAGVLAARGERAGVAFVPIGVTVAAYPLLLTGSERDALLGGGGALLLGGAVVAVSSSNRRAAVVALLAGFFCAAGWALALTRMPDRFDAADAARLPVALLFSGWSGWLTLGRRRLVGYLLAPGGPAVFDVLYLPVVAAAIGGGVLFGVLSVPLAAVAGVAALLAYPFWRRAAGRWFEQLVVGRLRRDAEIRAIEEERGRLAREIHDAPLQELSAVIRRLDDVPVAAGEVSALRNVAAQLRDVATALHPPVLEDLGLAAALDDLGEALAASHRDWEINVEVDDLTQGRRAGIPVEIAAYRIAQAAAGNSLRHSTGHRLGIIASVAPDAIDLSVTDDGGGIAERTVQLARRTGHFGMDSMRQRAEAVGGQVTIDSASDGVRVRFVWERPS
jgi:signal transduction histidine kinase